MGRPHSGRPRFAGRAAWQARGDQAGAAAHRARRPVDRRAGHRHPGRHRIGTAPRQQPGAQHRRRSDAALNRASRGRMPDVAGRHRRSRRTSSTAATTTGLKSPNPSTCGPSPAPSTGPAPRPRRPPASSRSPRNSAKRPSVITWDPSSIPNSKFIGQPAVARRPRPGASPATAACLCGLQLPGMPTTSRRPTRARSPTSTSPRCGRPAPAWASTRRPTSRSMLPVDCAAPHAMEVTGTVNLAEKFPDALPTEPDQDGFIKDSCTKMTDAYLAPVKLRTTTLTLIYPTVPMSSWTAGSREVACSIGATLGNGGWATLLNSAKGAAADQRPAPVPPPDIPEERLSLPPVPLQVPAQRRPQQPAAPPEDSAEQSAPPRAATGGAAAPATPASPRTAGSRPASAAAAAGGQRRTARQPGTRGAAAPPPPAPEPPPGN